MDARTEIIQQLFEDSWKSTLEIYDDLLTVGSWFFLNELRTFICELYNQSFNKKFRIGTSMERLIFSRSVEHGLRPDQKRVLIEPFSNERYHIRFYDFNTPGDRIQVFDEFTTENLSGNKRLLNNLTKLSNVLVD